MQIARKNYLEKPNDSFFAHEAHTLFDRVGLGSLDRAYECVKKDPTQPQSLYESLASEYVRNNRPDQVERILADMKQGPLQGKAASLLVQYYVERGELEKTLPLFQYFSPLLETQQALCSIIDAAEKTKNIEVAIAALKAMTGCRLWEACAKDFIRFLTEIGEEDRIEEIKAFKATAGTSPLSANDVDFYIRTNQLEKAESAALQLTDGKKAALSWIQEHYTKTNNQDGLNRIQAHLSEMRKNPMH